MRALVDTNIFLDVLLAREGLTEESQRVLDWFEENPGDGWIAWHTLPNLYYIGSKMVGRAAALEAIDEILSTFEVSPVASTDARRARNLGIDDFEDALQASAAISARAECIVTRNIHDFLQSPIPAVPPQSFLKTVAN